MFGGARLRHDLEISTKALAGSGTAYDYANLLAEPRSMV
jgi:hypothetical protein